MSSSTPHPHSFTSIQVQNALKGDRQAWEWTVERFHPILVGAARRRLRGRLAHHAEDLAQDVWMILLRSPSSFDQASRRVTPAFRSWLKSALQNLALNLYRHSATNPSRAVPPEEPDPKRGPLAQILARETPRLVQDAHAALDEADRQLLEDRLLGQTNAELGKSLGISEAAAAKRVQRAQKRLRQRLTPQVDSDFVDEFL